MVWICLIADGVHFRRSGEVVSAKPLHHTYSFPFIINKCLLKRYFETMQITLLFLQLSPLVSPSIDDSCVSQLLQWWLQIGDFSSSLIHLPLYCKDEHSVSPTHWWFLKSFLGGSMVQWGLTLTSFFYSVNCIFLLTIHLGHLYVSPCFVTAVL